MAISRRQALGVLAAPALRLSSEAEAQQPERAALAAIAEVVLPSEADRKAAVAAFVAWHDSYKEGADTDHGYGNTRIRVTGPPPSRNYAAQIEALDVAARAAGAASFAAASVEQRRSLIEAAIAAAGVERLPARPTGAHVATDLMGHYFNSSVANDLCYRAAIGRDDCRGLPGSEHAPR